MRQAQRISKLWHKIRHGYLSSECRTFLCVSSPSFEAHRVTESVSQRWCRSLSTGDAVAETDASRITDGLHAKSEASEGMMGPAESSEETAEETTSSAGSLKELAAETSSTADPTTETHSQTEEGETMCEGDATVGNSQEPVLELDTEKTKDLLEEDEVFDPATLRPPLDDFINFADFVKWPQFKEAFENLGDKVRFRHVASAFTSLRNILPRPPEQFLDSLAQTGIRLMPEARSNQIARLFYSCGKLRYINRDFMESMAQRMLQNRLFLEMDGCDISITIYSIAILSRFMLLVFAAEKGMRIVDLFQLYARETPPILFPSQPEVIAAFCQQIAIPNRLAGFKEQELANIVYGCGLLRAPDPVALQALAREIGNVHRLMKFTGQELSNIVYGFGLVQVKDEGMLYSLSDYLLKTGRLTELETQHLANILYGFSRMGFSYPPILAAVMKEVVQSERLSRFKEQELANIISCAALIGIQDQSFYKALGKEAVQSHRLPKYMEHNFSTIVLGMASVGVRDVDVLKKLASEMKRPERLPNYTSKDICDIIWAFNNLEFLDDGFILGLVAELRKPQRIRQSDAKVWQSCRAHVFSWSLAFPF